MTTINYYGYWEDWLTADDESSRVRSVNIRRGRDSALSGNEYQSSDPGKASVILNNADGRFDLFGQTSPISGYLLPNKRAAISANVGGVIYPLFAGSTRNIRPFSQTKTAAIDAIDGIEYLRNRPGDDATDVRANYLVSEAIQDILASAGYPYADATGAEFTYTFPATLSSAAIENNGDIIPLFWQQSSKTAWDQLCEIARTYAGDVYAMADGTFAYRARRYGGVSKVSITDADITRDSEQQQPWGEIRNSVQITTSPRSLTTAGGEVWRLYDVIEIAAGASKTIWAEYRSDNYGGPKYSITTPAATTDYTANAQADGLGANKTTNLTVALTAYATRAKLVLTNTDAATIYVTLLKLRGQIYIAPNKTALIATNSTSITAYGKTVLNVETDFLQTEAIAAYHRDYALALYKDVRQVLTVKIINRPELQFPVDLFDTVTLSISALSLSGEYMVTYIEHDLSPQRHITTWRLEPTAATQAGFAAFTFTFPATFGW